ncbi:LisH and RanBPM domains containing protein isoform 2 [Hibiscus syriacus]|uniref:LisH and RanBPM domains containing protein isoform 2 n=1 Tax=Hibiscus syriacus TaxID=106335 RepID=A0A6A3BND4_HIBSY|nr:LisH and RanBPM domains containing protein isoform 2 [Hibiscus syriacus]
MNSVLISDISVYRRRNVLSGGFIVGGRLLQAPQLCAQGLTVTGCAGCMVLGNLHKQIVKGWASSGSSVLLSGSSSGIVAEYVGRSGGPNVTSRIGSGYPHWSVGLHSDIVITREEWEKRLNDVKIRKEDMNKLVMNFLVTEGYAEAAEKFRMESGTEYIDLATISDCMAVKKAVQCGNVEDAIEKVNDLNPEVGSWIQYIGYKPATLFPSPTAEIDRIDSERTNRRSLGICSQSFLEELERTVSLLAFEDVSNCPVGELLDISQRLKTASELNAAILTSQSHEKDPKLPSLLKMLLWAQLDEKAAYPCINDLSNAALEDPAV